MSYQQFGHVDPEERLDHVDASLPDEEYEPRRRLPGILLAVGVMGIFAGGLWFAYHQGTKHAAVSVAATPSNSVPLIRADTDPVKVKPDKVGGMNIPDKDDPLYSMRPGGTAEHILPPPEAPAPRPVAPPPAPPPAAVATAPAAEAQPFPVPLAAPPQVGAPAKPAVKTPEVAAKPVPAGEGVRIQLASVRTPEAARDEWARLKRDNDDLLGRLSGVAVRADLGERGIWYRVEAGPVTDKAAAARLCKALKERDLGCALVP
jgi:hypothetical protein